MIFYSGTKNTSILEQYVGDVDCKTCEKKTEHLLVIYCKAFVLGLFYPFKWWAWEKQGYTKCRKCGRQSEVSEGNMNLPPKIYHYFRQTKIPLRYKVPLLVTMSSLILFGLLIMGGFFSALISIVTPVDKKFVGKWQNEYQTSSLFVYNDNKYTYVANDTVIFGEYQKSRGKILFPFRGRENLITTMNINPLYIENEGGGRIVFRKAKKDELDNMYRKENNDWRMKPDRPQSNEEIRAKILAMMNFEKLRFQNAIDHKNDLVSDDPNSPIYYAMNGFAVNYETFPKWRYTFYNNDDWLKANRLLEEEFPTEYKVNLDISAFVRSVEFLNLYTKKIKEADLKFLDKPDTGGEVYE